MFLDERMTVVSNSGIGSLARELEALSSRIDMAKANAAERAQAVATEARQTPGEQTPSGAGPARRPRSPRNLIVALGLVLLAVAATIVASDRPYTAVPQPPARPDGAMTASQPVPTSVAGAPAAPNPAGPPPVAVQDTARPAPPVLAPPTVVTPSVPEATTTVDVVVGDSFWSIAERQVALVSGEAATTTEVARYWAALVEVNQGQLTHAGNPNLIYPGQTFSLP